MSFSDRDSPGYRTAVPNPINKDVRSGQRHRGNIRMVTGRDGPRKRLTWNESQSFHVNVFNGPDAEIAAGSLVLDKRGVDFRTVEK